MSRHKYFSDIENKECEHPSTWGAKDDSRSQIWYQERRKYGFDSRETWSLNTTFYIWLYERLMMYKEKANEIVDLTWHKFEYKGETLTQIECIDRMIEGCKIYIQNSYDYEIDKEKLEKVKEVAEIWALVLPVMWW